MQAHSDGSGTGSEFVVRLPALGVKAASPEDDGGAQRAAASLTDLPIERECLNGPPGIVGPGWPARF